MAYTPLLHGTGKLIKTTPVHPMILNLSLKIVLLKAVVLTRDINLSNFNYCPVKNDEFLMKLVQEFFYSPDEVMSYWFEQPIGAYVGFVVEKSYIWYTLNR